MTITIKQVTIFDCDSCCELVQIDYNLKFATKMAREVGWSIGKKILCPLCNPKELRGKK